MDYGNSLKEYQNRIYSDGATLGELWRLFAVFSPPSQIERFITFYVYANRVFNTRKNDSQCQREKYFDILYLFPIFHDA